MVDVNAQLLAVKEQVDLSPLSSADEKLRMSLLGQLYVADWKYLMVAAGRAFRLNLGTVGAGGDITLVGAGTVIDGDQPHGVVAVDSGLALIPMELDVSAMADTDAENDVVDILLLGDRTQATAAGATATVETPANLLGGGPAFGGRAFSIVTGDIADPSVASDILYYKRWEALGADPLGPVTFPAQKEWSYPSIYQGPSQLVLYVAGTVAVTFMGSLVVGAVPSSWFPAS